MYLVWQAWANSIDRKRGVTSGSIHSLPLIQLFLDTTLGSKLYLFKFLIKYGKGLKCLNTKGKYGKERDTEIKW